MTYTRATSLLPVRSSAVGSLVVGLLAVGSLVVGSSAVGSLVVRLVVGYYKGVGL